MCVRERESGGGRSACVTKTQVVCVHDREGVSQEGKKNLHRYKEQERDMYAIVEA